MRRTLLLLICACAVATGCGGSASTDTDADATVSISTAGASATLAQIADQAETVISDQREAITSSTSKEDVSARLGEAQAQVESLAEQLDAVQTDDEVLAAARDRLHEGLHALADQTGELQQSVESGDIEGAIQQLQSSDAITEIRQAIEEIRAQSG